MIIRTQSLRPRCHTSCVEHLAQQVAYNQIFMSSTLAETWVEQIFLETNINAHKFTHKSCSADWGQMMEHMMEHLVPHVASAKNACCTYVILPNAVNENEQQSTPLENFG